MTELKIYSLGSWAALYQGDKKHFSLLFELDGEGYVIDPSVKRSELPKEIKLKGVFITQTDKDHYLYLNEYQDLPIHSTSAIFEKLEIPAGLKLKPITTATTFEGIDVKIIKVTHRIGEPSIGLRFDKGSLKIAVVPEFLVLGKSEENLMRNCVWIVGAGDYGKNDEKEGKISFLNLISLAKELKPTMIFLTNKRKDLIFHVNEISKILRDWNGRMLEDADIIEEEELKKEKTFSKSQPWHWYKPAYRIFSLKDLEYTPHFQEGKAVIDGKFDGLRMQAIKSKGKIEIWTDPDEVKEGESANKTDRLPWIVKEFEDMNEDDFRLDCELIMIKENKGLHRTAANALVNGKFDPKEPSKMAHLQVFDILEFEGEDVRSFPLKERIETLSNFKNTAHIHFIIPTTDPNKPSLSYIVNLGKLSEVKKAMDKIISNLDGKLEGFPQAIVEGVMIKLLSHQYEAPQNHGTLKYKVEFEIDGLVVGKHQIIQMGKPINVWNYDVCVGEISAEHANAIMRTDKKRVIEYKGKYYNVIGRTDNSKLDVKIGDILRVDAEDVNEYDTDDPRFKYYGCYVMRVRQLVPEKNRPDPILVPRRLSEYTGERISFAPEEKLRKTEELIYDWREGIEKSISDDVKAAQDEGKMSDEMYEKYAKDNEPLPPSFYPDYAEGDAWAQMHFRGIEPKEREKFEAGEMSIAKMIEDHSMHIDFRMNLGQEKLIQWVLTEDSIESYINSIKGKTDPKTGNISKALAVVKPSAEKPIKGIEKNEITEALIDREGAKLCEKLAIKEKSYIIRAGGVGATPYKDAWMQAIWIGKVKAGLQREDCHEYFLYTEESEDKEIFEGRYLIRCFRIGVKGKGARWWFWKCSNNPKPQDPIFHKAQKNSYFPVPARKVTRFGKEAYD